MTRLSQFISAYQQKYDVENRAMAHEIGISQSTLSRIKKGAMPDAYGLALLIVWLTRPDGERGA